MPRYSFSTKFTFGLLVIAATIGYFSLLSNTWPSGSGTGRAVFPSQKQVEATVDVGLVVAYGRPLPTPYRLVMTGDSIAINGMAYEPRPADQPERPAAVVTDEIRAKVKLEGRIVARYVELAHQLKGALPEYVVAEEFRTDPLIASIDVSVNGDIILNYRDGQSEHIDLLSFLTPPVSEAERARLQREHFDQLADLLRSGGGIVFGKGYDLLLPARDVAELRRAAARRPLDPLAERTLAELLSFPQAVADVTSSIAYWSVEVPATPPLATSAEVRGAVYREGYWSPCSSWRVTVTRREDGFSRQRSCPQNPDLNQGEVSISADEFSRYVYIEALLSTERYSQLKLMATPPSFGADIDAQIARCYQNSKGVDTVCSNALGVVVVNRHRPSLVGMLDADSIRTLEYVDYSQAPR